MSMQITERLLPRKQRLTAMMVSTRAQVPEVTLSELLQESALLP